MVYFKNYSLDYNAKAVDVFKAIAVCSRTYDNELLKEGNQIDIDVASFYGIISSSKAGGEKYTLNIIAESYTRELRNTNITVASSFRQVNAIDLIKKYLLPASWELEYPEELDDYPRYISYILRNGTVLSHITTLLQLLGLDFTIYTTKSGNEYTKTIKSYFKDKFDELEYAEIEEWKQFGNFSISTDLGKLATSVIVLPSDSEQGITQVWMDAEMKDWDNAPYIYEIKDTSMKKLEMSADSKYLWYYPASTDYEIGLFEAGETIIVDDERMVINSIHVLPGVYVASWESGELSEDDFDKYFTTLAHYNPASDAIVASMDFNASVYIESLERDVTLSDKRNVGAYGSENSIHAVYDDILFTNVDITVSSYLYLGENLPETDGFIWLGSEFCYYTEAEISDDLVHLTGLQRGIPACASQDCEHCGTRASLKPVGWAYGCPWSHADSNTCLSDYCSLVADLKSAFSITTNIHTCPLCFDAESPCPVLKCPNISESAFPILCPKGYTLEEVEWTDRYQHHKDAIVFPASYYDEDHPTAALTFAAKDSLIYKYGYLPVQISVKGVGDQDALDKVAQSYLRLSALPITGQFTLFNYDAWTVPASFFPGDVLYVKVATHGRYDLEQNVWYPTHWFDFASDESNCPGNEDEWREIPTGSKNWYRIKQKFVIQRTYKSQREMPTIYFGTPGSDFSDFTEYIRDLQDTATQRHRNQERGKIIATSENGMAAKIKNLKTGKVEAVRMVK